MRKPLIVSLILSLSAMAGCQHPVTKVPLDIDGYRGDLHPDWGTDLDTPPDLSMAQCWYGQTPSILTDHIVPSDYWRRVSHEIEHTFSTTKHPVQIVIQDADTAQGKKIFVVGGSPAQNVRGKSIVGGDYCNVFSGVLFVSGSRDRPGMDGRDPVALWVTFMANVCGHELAHEFGWRHNDGTDPTDSMATGVYRPIWESWHLNGLSN